MAILKPSPSSPIRLEAGTSQSSNITARVGWEFHPTFRQFKKKLNTLKKFYKKIFFLMNFVILNHLGLRILKTHFYFTKYKMNFEKHPLKTHHHKELSPLSNLFRFHKEELFLTSRHQTFFSFLPKANPGDPFSTSRQEIPLGPCSPVLHITTYTSVSPPPLIKACQQRLTFRTFFVQKKLTIQIMHR